MSLAFILHAFVATIVLGDGLNFTVRRYVFVLHPIASCLLQRNIALESCSLMYVYSYIQVLILTEQEETVENCYTLIFAFWIGDGRETILSSAVHLRIFCVFILSH
jgi:hypothetical protein